MSDISKCAERYRDPAVEKRLIGLDGKTPAVHPSEFVERYGCTSTTAETVRTES